jgi:hypothetical protein
MPSQRPPSVVNWFAASRKHWLAFVVTGVVPGAIGLLAAMFGSLPGFPWPIWLGFLILGCLVASYRAWRDSATELARVSNELDAFKALPVDREHQSQLLGVIQSTVGRINDRREVTYEPAALSESFVSHFPKIDQEIADWNVAVRELATARAAVSQGLGETLATFPVGTEKATIASAVANARLVQLEHASLERRQEADGAWLLWLHIPSVTVVPSGASFRLLAPRMSWRRPTARSSTYLKGGHNDLK